MPLLIVRIDEDLRYAIDVELQKSKKSKEDFIDEAIRFYLAKKELGAKPLDHLPS